MAKQLKVAYLASEASPLAKVGGLGDVVGSLPAALSTLQQSPDIRVFLPLYPFLNKSGMVLEPIDSFDITHTSGPLLAEVYQMKIQDIRFYLVDGSPIAASPSVYSGNNYLDGCKFTFFSLAAMELSRKLNWQPDIIHAHDWHTAPAVYYLRLIRENDKFYRNTKSLLTVHNLPYLGYDTNLALQEFGLPQAHMSSLPEWAEQLPLPLGLLSADKINTVSNGYAQEMLTSEFGANLEGFLRTRKDDLSGILNGLDQTAWNPETDPHLSENYSLDSLSKRVDNKTNLLTELGLDPDTPKPLLAMINRMDYQKGVDLVPDALKLIADLDWQAVILGTGDPSLENTARRLDLNVPGVRCVLRYDEGLARRIYGASDIILIPSRYEPCGLTQMIGMRYGCVPLARATGGLKDTIIDYHQAKPGKGTGFLFEKATSLQLSNTIRQALSVFQDQRRWNGIQRRGMKQDFSWESSANKYYQLYLEMI